MWWVFVALVPVDGSGNQKNAVFEFYPVKVHDFQHNFSSPGGFKSETYFIEYLVGTCCSFPKPSFYYVSLTDYLFTLF